MLHSPLAHFYHSLTRSYLSRPSSLHQEDLSTLTHRSINRVIFCYNMYCFTHSLQLPVEVILLNVKETSQRLHASRRVFETLQREGITTAVVHHITFPEGTHRCVYVLGVMFVHAFASVCACVCLCKCLFVCACTV